MERLELIKLVDLASDVRDRTRAVMMAAGSLEDVEERDAQQIIAADAFASARRLHHALNAMHEARPKN